MKIEINVATRPFVNRTPHLLLLGGLLLAAVSLSAWNIAVFLRTQSEKNAAESQLAELAREESELRRRQQEVQAMLGRADLKPLGVRVAAANDVLAERAVSWSLLLERVEEILPWKAALTSIGTNVTRQGIQVNLDVHADSHDDLLDLLDALEASPCFSDAYPSQEERLKGSGTGFDMKIEALHDPYCGDEPDVPESVRLLRSQRSGGSRG